MNPHAPPRAPLVFAGGSIKAYAQASHHLSRLDPDTIEKILVRAKATGCGEDTSTELSWPTWRNDVHRALEQVRATQ
jgi:hypothetical protein